MGLQPVARIEVESRNIEPEKECTKIFDKNSLHSLSKNIKLLWQKFCLKDLHAELVYEEASKTCEAKSSSVEFEYKSLA